jgi:hypothetical protein
VREPVRGYDEGQKTFGAARNLWLRISVPMRMRRVLRLVFSWGEDDGSGRYSGMSYETRFFVLGEECHEEEPESTTGLRGLRLELFNTVAASSSCGASGRPRCLWSNTHSILVADNQPLKESTVSTIKLIRSIGISTVRKLYSTVISSTLVFTYLI